MSALVLIIALVPIGMVLVRSLTVPDGHRMILAAIAAGAVVALISSVAIAALREESRSRGRRLQASGGLVVLPAGLPDCPYCKSPIDARAPEGTLRCPACETAHHADCYRENQGCTIHGCAR